MALKKVYFFFTVSFKTIWFFSKNALWYLEFLRSIETIGFVNIMWLGGVFQEN